MREVSRRFTISAESQHSGDRGPYFMTDIAQETFLETTACFARPQRRVRPLPFFLCFKRARRRRRQFTDEDIMQ